MRGAPRWWCLERLSSCFAAASLVKGPGHAAHGDGHANTTYRGGSDCIATRCLIGMLRLRLCNYALSYKLQILIPA